MSNKNANMRHLEQLLSISPDLPVHALVVDNEGLTESFLSAGHSRQSVMYAALFLLQYASDMCEDEGDAPLKADIDEFLELLEEDYDMSISVEPQSRPIN